MKKIKKIFLGIGCFALLPLTTIAFASCSVVKNDVSSTFHNYVWNPTKQTVVTERELSQLFAYEWKDNKFIINDYASGVKDFSELNIPSFATFKSVVYPVDISTAFVQKLNTKQNDIKKIIFGGNLTLDLFYKNKPVGDEILPSRIVHFQKLESVTFEYGTVSIPDELFSDIPTLIDAKIPDSVEFIGSRSFYHAKFKRIELPSTIKLLSTQCFGFTALEEVIFRPAASTMFSTQLVIGSSAFCNTNLSTFLFPKNINKLVFEFTLLTQDWVFPFFECTKLKTIYSNATVKTKIDSVEVFKTYMSTNNMVWNAYIENNGKN